MNPYTALANTIKALDPAKVMLNDEDHTLKSLLFMVKHETFRGIRDVIATKIDEIESYLRDANEELKKFEANQRETPRKGPKVDNRKKKKSTPAGPVYDPDCDYGEALQHFDIIEDKESGLFIIQTRPRK